MKIRQPVKNTFDRVGINYKLFLNLEDGKNYEAANWITGETVMTYPLVGECIKWVYRTQLDYERGNHKVNLSDFDRVRYWILEVDNEAYMKCID